MSKPLPNIKYGTDADEQLIGTNGPDLIYGFGGNDKLYGQGGDDVLYGGTGNDIVDGGTGADIMFGGPGDDLYRVDNFGDVVSEESTGPGIDDGGTDTVQSTITYTLGAFVEKLELTGTAAINGMGNNLGNVIKGNSANNVLSGFDGADDIRGYDGNDLLIGGSGRDTLTGGTGADTFVFGKADATSTDRVVDFSSGEGDRLAVYATDYGLTEGHGLVGGALDPAYFALVSGTQKQGTVAGHGQFLYNTTTSSLMWDADGSGTAASGIAIANFSPVNSVPVTLSADVITVFSALPTVTVQNATGGAQPEGENAYFMISLSTPWNHDVTVHYSTASGTATSGSDFAGVLDGTAVIPAGAPSVVVPIALFDDGLGENTESFTFQLTSATLDDSTPLSLAGASATGLIDDHQPYVVAIHDTAAFGSPDPMGLAYVPGLDTLFLCDLDNSLFALNTDGTLKPDGAMTLGFTQKSAGLAFDPTTGRMYIADDDKLAIDWVDPANPTVELGGFDATHLGSTDTEDVAVNPNNGHVFIVNGGDFGAPKIIETDATGSQIFSVVDLKTAVQGQPIGSPEGAVYDPTHDVFFVAGNNYDIKVVDRNGTVLNDITILQNYRNPTGNIGTEIQGLTLAPSSDPNDDPATLSLYVADAGLLRSSANDGRLIEIADPFWHLA